MSRFQFAILAMVALAAHLEFAMPRLTAKGLPAMVTVVASDEDGHPVSEAEVLRI